MLLLCSYVKARANYDLSTLPSISCLKFLVRPRTYFAMHVHVYVFVPSDLGIIVRCKYSVTEKVLCKLTS